jgi:ABC-type nitrate/sulfonate/bicarbonate transport system substrate-binding protein
MGSARILRPCGVVGFVLFFAALSQATAQTPEAQKSNPKIKILTLLGRPLQIVVAEKQGFLAKSGVEIETENLPSSDLLRTSLAAGKGDLAYLAVDNAVAMVELAHEDVVILMGGEGSQNELFAQPEFKSVAELRGKILIVDAPNTAYALQMKQILRLGGLQPGKDYEIKPFGATPQRLIAMREHKEFAGTMLGPPASVSAKHDGFVSLGTVQNLIGPYQAAGWFAERKWAQEHRAALISYLAAIVEAQRWIMTPANKQQAIELMIAQSKLSPEAAAETYDLLFNQPGGFEKDAALDLTGFETVLKLRAEIEGQWNGHPPSTAKYYDDSFYKAALAKLEKPDGSHVTLP